MPSRYTTMTDEELFAECEVDTFCSGGKGGQNVNRRETAVRLTHRPSGLVVVCQDERYQLRNKMLALATLRERLERLHRRRKPRIPTKKTRGAKERTLTEKKIQGQKKEHRRKPAASD